MPKPKEQKKKMATKLLCMYESAIVFIVLIPCLLLYVYIYIFLIHINF